MADFIDEDLSGSRFERVDLTGARFERGRLVQWFVSPKLGVPCAFGFRASPDIWRKYLSHPAEPLYHDVFAMLMRVPGFVLEGDSLVAMQHARALHRVMKVMRLVGAA